MKSSSANPLRVELINVAQRRTGAASSSASSIAFDPLDGGRTTIDADAWMVHADHLLSPPPPPHSSDYVIRLELQKDVMRTRHLTPPYLRTLLSERLHGKALVSASETNALTWVVRLRFLNMKEMREVGSLRADQEAILCHRAVNMLLETVVVSGHPDVVSSNTAEMRRFDEVTGKGTTEWVVHAYGNCLVDCASSECVDWERTTSDDLWEVFSTLGLEACVHVLYDQMKQVLSFDGTYLDDRHLVMICDTICRGGSLMPLNRHGMNRTTASPLMRCSFEETVDVLCEAAMFAEHENARGTTTSIMCGQLSALGTGTVEVLFPRSTLPVRNESALLRTAGRAMRSTCRSHTMSGLPEELEYLCDSAKVTGTRPMTPPPGGEEQGGGGRKRTRFRPVSPTSDG